MSSHVGVGLAAASYPTEPVDRRGSGRIRHDEKITVYVSTEELVALEQARLTLRAQYGMAVDRGRIVREAIAAMLADLEASWTSPRSPCPGSLTSSSPISRRRAIPGTWTRQANSWWLPQRSWISRRPG